MPSIKKETYKISKAQHSYRILSGSVAAIQIAIILRGFELIKINIETSDLAILLFLIIVWLILEILLRRQYIEK